MNLLYFCSKIVLLLLHTYLNEVRPVQASYSQKNKNEY